LTPTPLCSFLCGSHGLLSHLPLSIPGDFQDLGILQVPLNYLSSSLPPQPLPQASSSHISFGYNKFLLPRVWPPASLWQPEVFLENTNLTIPLHHLNLFSSTLWNSFLLESMGGSFPVYLSSARPTTPSSSPTCQHLFLF
jgi:hypothetical protein